MDTIVKIALHQLIEKANAKLDAAKEVAHLADDNNNEYWETIRDDAQAELNDGQGEAP